MQPKVFLTRRVPDRIAQEFASLFDLTHNDREVPPSREELLATVAGCQGLCTMLTDRVDDELLDAAGSELRIVSNYAVGFDNIDVEACTRHGVLATNTPDVLTKATAELAMTLMLTTVRRVAEGDRFVRSRTPWIWGPTMMLGGTLNGRTLGIVGLGRIGLEIAHMATAFGMQIIYTDEAPRQGVDYEFVSLDDILARADVITIHVPLLPSTRHLFGTEQFKKMRKDSYLVNTSRGPVIDEAALAEALRTGEIAGAGLDVYEREPEITEALLELENCVLAPHLGSATADTRDAMGQLCIDALKAVLLENRVPGNALNPDVLQASGANA
jgi:glyoxylate reductase